MSKYDDIINAPRPISKKHKPMTRYNRAAQFASFAALVGYEDLIEETGRQVDSRISIDENKAFEINGKLIYLANNKDVEANYTIFKADDKKKGGKYINIKGSILKVDLDKNVIVLKDKQIIKIDLIDEIDII